MQALDMENETKANSSASLKLPLCDLVCETPHFTLWKSQAGNPGDELDNALTFFQLSDKQLSVGSTDPAEIAQVLNIDPEVLQKCWIQDIIRGGVDALWHHKHLHIICYIL